MLNLVANNISLSVWGSLSPPDKSRKIQGGDSSLHRINVKIKIK